MDGNNTWVYIVGLVVAVLAAWFSASTASKKGHSPIGYGILGFFLPLVGIIVALVLKDRGQAARS